MMNWKDWFVIVAVVNGCGPSITEPGAEDDASSDENSSETTDGADEDGDGSGDLDGGEESMDDSDGGGAGDDGTDNGSNDGCFMEGTPTDPRCLQYVDITTEHGFSFNPETGTCVGTGGGETTTEPPFLTQIECMMTCVIEPQLTASRSAWECLIEKHEESYTYVVPYYNSDLSQETTIVVDRGKVVERSFHQTDDWKDPISWTETGSEIGSHPEGAAPVLLDALYDWCVGVGQSAYIYDYIIFAVFESGALKECYQFPHDCSEWCVTGVYISDLWFTR